MHTVRRLIKANILQLIFAKSLLVWDGKMYFTSSKIFKRLRRHRRIGRRRIVDQDQPRAGIMLSQPLHHVGTARADGKAPPSTSSTISACLSTRGFSAPDPPLTRQTW